MIIKKINAVLSMLTVLLLFAHSTYEIIAYSFFIYDVSVVKILARSFMTVAIIHVIISIIILLFFHEKKLLTKYGKYNWRTLIQRISALAVIVLLAIHIKTANYLLSDGKTMAGIITVLIIEFLFFTSVMLHIGSSFSRAMISLGIITAKKTQTRVDIIVSVICIIWLLAACIAIMRTQYILAKPGVLIS